MRGIKYSLKAIPTTYNGIMMRSRLEARWAAFFDACGWPWTYEPFDLNGWAPDFQLNFVRPVLVEVKPHTDHLLGRVFRDITAPIVAIPNSPRVLLVGAQPRSTLIGDGFSGSLIGWGTDYELLQEGNREIEETCLTACRGHVGLSRVYGHSTCFVCASQKHPARRGRTSSQHQKPWAKACNATQWHPKN